MRFLAVDTATRSCSVAVVSSGTTLAEATFVSTLTHSRHVMEMVRWTLHTARIEPGQLDGFAVTRGPGSFTGLRIGISTVKGLAFAAGKPLVGISSLEVLASQVPETPILITPLVDARKGEVYLARYRYRNGRLLEVEPARAADPREAAEGLGEPSLFIGDGARLHRPVIESAMGGQARFAPEELNHIRAAAVARLAMERWQAGETEAAAGFVPFYIRQSDAELRLGARQKTCKPD